MKELVSINIIEKTETIDLLEYMNEVFSKNNEDFFAVEITGFEMIDFESNELQIIKFLDNFQEERDFGFVKSIGQSSNSTNYRVYCKGNCDCSLEGVIEAGTGISYVQCKCNECSMYYEFSSKISFNDTEYDFNIIDIIQKHDPEFLNQYDEINITSVVHENHDPYSIIYFEYSDKESFETRSFALIHSAESNKGFTVSCNGNVCDCRERFYPATGAIECTCNPCLMIVEELK